MIPTAITAGILGVILLLMLASAVVAARPGWVASHPRKMLAGIGLLSLAAALALVEGSPPDLRLRIDPSSEPLLAQGDPAGVLYHEAVRDFGHDEVYAVALVCEEVFTPSCLLALEEMSGRVARLQGVRRVSSLADATALRWNDERDWIEIRPFMESVPEAPGDLAALRRRALEDNVYRQTLVAEDGRAAALNVAFRAMDDASFLASGIDGSIDEIMGEALGPGQGYHVAGRPHVKVRVYRGIVSDLAILLPLALCAMAAVLWFFFRTLRGVLLPLGTAFLANLWTFGAMAVADEALTLLSGLLGPLLLAIGSVYGVHVVARYEEIVPRAQRRPAEYAERALREVRLPALVAGLTTLLGFGSLLLTDVPAVFQLGLFSMLGIASSTLLALVLVPASLALLPALELEESGRRAGLRLDRQLAALGRWVALHRRSVIVAFAGFCVLALLALPRIEVDTDYLSYFAEDDPIRRDFDAVNRLLAGVVPIYVVIDGQGEGSFRDPELVASLDALEEQLGQVRGVSRTLSFNDLLGRLNRAFHSGDPAHERAPADRGGITELLFMLPKDDLSPFLTVDHGRANIIVRTGAVGSSEVIALEQRLRSVLAANPLPGGARARITGNAILLAHSADAITRAQPRGIAVAAAAIFVLISLALRSPGLGLVAMIPNLVPVAYFFGLLGLGWAPLSLPVSMIGCMALGIAIDDSAHFLVRYRRERAGGLGPEAAALACNRQVGRPIVITSVMLCLGFLVMTGSSFATLQEFGFLSAMTMGLCLLTDLVLLPAVLVRFRV
ncbi:MAG: MMPL family transporter [Myxococcota bacterium]|nr:MMPL family transporter [Myxococcota bacterium]